MTMDSGFLVVKGITEMHKVRVYGQALIKKRGQGWPKFVPGEEIDEHFQDQAVGTTGTLTTEVDGI